MKHKIRLSPLNVTIATLILAVLLGLAATSGRAQQPQPCSTAAECMQKNKRETLVFYCNAPTKSGSSCKHRVKKAGDHCWQHGGAK